jgi:uncharacterized protein YndB with AHSA1/START domain
MSDTPNLTLVKIIPAPRQRVFEAWLDREALGHFMCPAPGMSVSKVEVEPRVGGKFLVLMKAGDSEMPHHGEYLAIEPHERLEFTWLSAHAGDSSAVTLLFSDAPGGHTRLKLEHRGLPSAESAAKHEGGWGHILDMLAASPTNQ